MPTQPRISVSGPGEGRGYQVFGAPVAVHTPRDNPFMLADHPVPPGYEVPLHVHEDEDEAAFVIDGAVTFFTAEDETVAGPGTVVTLPRGVAHGFANRGKAEARMIVVTRATRGAGLEGVFRELDDAGRRGDMEPAMIAAALGRNGVTLLG